MLAISFLGSSGFHFAEVTSMVVMFEVKYIYLFFKKCITSDLENLPRSIFYLLFGCLPPSHWLQLNE